MRVFAQSSENWEGDIWDENLYYMWRKIKNLDNNGTNTDNLAASINSGHSTIEANNCTLTGINLDWLNDVSVLEMIEDEDNILVPYWSPKT